MTFTPRSMTTFMNEQYLFGIHAVQALLNNSQRKTHRLIINAERQDQRLSQLLSLAQQMGIPIEKANAQQLKQRFPEANHQGIIAAAQPLPNYVESDIPHLLQGCKAKPFILILDGVTDPHNLGACLRTADAAGVDFVIIPKDKSASISPTVSKVACGAAETIPLVRVTNLVRAMESLKAEGVWIYGAAGEASDSLYQLDAQGAIAIVLGAEGEGIRRLTRDHCDGLFALPMNGTVESLNVSVAAGISLYEVVRQRRGLNHG